MEAVNGVGVRVDETIELIKFLEEIFMKFIPRIVIKDRSNPLEYFSRDEIRQRYRWVRYNTWW